MNEDICSRDAEQFAPGTQCFKSVSDIAGIWVSTRLTPNLSKLSTLESHGEGENPSTVSLRILGGGVLPSLGKKLEKGANSKPSPRS